MVKTSTDALGGMQSNSKAGSLKSKLPQLCLAIWPRQVDRWGRPPGERNGLICRLRPKKNLKLVWGFCWAAKNNGSASVRQRQRQQRVRPSVGMGRIVDFDKTKFSNYLFLAQNGRFLCFRIVTLRFLGFKTDFSY